MAINRIEHKQALRKLFEQVEPGETISLKFLNGMADRSGNYRVLETALGRGQGGSVILTLASQDSYEIVNIKRGRGRSKSIFAELRPVEGEGEQLVTGTKDSDYIAEASYGDQTVVLEDVPTGKRRGRPPKAKTTTEDVPVEGQEETEAEPAPKASTRKRGPGGKFQKAAQGSVAPERQSIAARKAAAASAPPTTKRPTNVPVEVAGDEDVPLNLPKTLRIPPTLLGR